MPVVRSLTLLVLSGIAAGWSVLVFCSAASFVDFSPTELRLLQGELLSEPWWEEAALSDAEPSSVAAQGGQPGLKILAFLDQSQSGSSAMNFEATLGAEKVNALRAWMVSQAAATYAVLSKELGLLTSRTVVEWIYGYEVHAVSPPHDGAPLFLPCLSFSLGPRACCDIYSHATSNARCSCYVRSASAGVRTHSLRDGCGLGWRRNAWAAVVLTSCPITTTALVHANLFSFTVRTMLGKWFIRRARTS